MGGYHNIVLPDRFSTGSTVELGYDTRITALENGQEHRLARYNPWGRRKYNLRIDFDEFTGVVNTLYDFYQMRQGALNSFKFRDPFRFTTAPDGRSAFTDNDVVLLALGADAFQCVRRITDTVHTVTRPITKIIQGPGNVPEFRADGVPTVDRTIDLETGIVTFGPSVSPVTSASGGFQFYTPVRFGPTTDEAFKIAMEATLEGATLPGIELFEELSTATISQDQSYGGAYNWGPVTSNFTTSEINGRLQIFDPQAGGLQVNLPNNLDTPLGGPIFAFQNESLVNSIGLADASGSIFKTMAADTVVTVYMGVSDIGEKVWLAI